MKMEHGLIRMSMAFLKRDLLVAASYRASFMMDFVSIAARVATFFFIAKMFGPSSAPFMAEFGGDYFPFVLIGLAFGDYFKAAMDGFSGNISTEQSEGTIEVLLLSPRPLSAIMIAGSLGDFVVISIRVLAYIIAGSLLFGFTLGNINFASFFVSLVLTILSFSALGILSAAFLLVFKRGDPVNFAVSGLSRLLGGVYFPIAVLPGWLHGLSYLLPITHALSALRKSILMGSGITEIYPELAALLVFASVLLPASVLCFNLALKRTKLNGSLLFT
ncbi:MAG: ABC transporter permease [Candidatus Omnitrophica bacterium]|nr:ABC transporter permease [Candidatus Omnitrophota bacterium]